MNRKILEEKLISVIIPVYNAERYLKRSLNSIVKQTYQNLQVILVDDGSTDMSVSICREFSASDPRIEVIQQKNGGVSSARNKGLQQAIGYYIVFVDADDWLPSSAIEDLVNSSQHGGMDIVAGSRIRIDGINNHCFRYEQKEAVKNDKNWPLVLEAMHGGPWAKLFKREIIVRNDLSFPLGVKWGEDAIFLYRYLRNCQCICTSDKIVYAENRLYDNSATKKFYEEYNSWFTDAVRAYTELVDQKYATRFCETVFFWTCLHYARNPSLHYGEVVDRVKQTYQMMSQYATDFSLVDQNSSQHILFDLLRNHQEEKAYDLLMRKPKISFKSRIARFLYWPGRYAKRLYYYHSIH